MNTNKSAHRLIERLKSTYPMIAELHPVELALTGNDVQSFQVQSWVINRSYIDEILCDGILRSLLTAPKNHIYNKWTSKIIACLSDFTIDSPWLATGLSLDLKKTDIKSHTLNLPVSRLIARSVKQMVDSSDWKINIGLSLAFLYSVKKSANILRLMASEKSGIVSQAMAKEFMNTTSEYQDTEEFILAIAAETIKTDEDIRTLFSSIQLIVESNWMLNDAMFMESFAQNPSAIDVISGSEISGSKTQTAQSFGQSLAFVRNRATADFLK